jgi:hypothetical protein
MILHTHSLQLLPAMFQRFSTQFWNGEIIAQALALSRSREENRGD